MDWDKVVGYFQILAKSSDRIHVEELGKSADGRPFIAATIADAEALKHLDRYIAIQQRLANPRKTNGGRIFTSAGGDRPDDRGTAVRGRSAGTAAANPDLRNNHSRGQTPDIVPSVRGKRE
jgi:hypothetical protein